MKWVRSVLVAAMLGGAAAPAAAIDKLVVFGDSLVDAGNAYLGTGGLTAQPGYGYFDGRYSNGPEWTDIIQKRLTGNYTVPFLLGGENFAVGGAQAAMDRPLLGFTVPGLASQLGLFALSGQSIDPNALYVLNFGNNDVSALLAGLAAAPNATAADIFRAQYTAAFVGNYLGAINYLNAAGANHFLIGGVPNPDQPEGVALEAALQAGFTTLNLKSGTSFTQIDYFGFFSALRNDPTAFGLPADLDTNLAHACVDISAPQSNPNPDCSHYFSFDGIHPTAPIHAALASYIGSLLAVPEPAVWLQMIAGFGLVGVVIRQRKAAVA
ncbi:PEPxxWA-CTERM sorting domain-containing protein [Sphingosinicellaceae bacterium]|nr:PEPxxWA-CTERM sorting domain-containing protein [Sphingosinicellaceae bacterium]